MNSGRSLLLFAGLVVAGTAVAADYLKGKKVADIVSGNTIYVFYTACHDGEANEMLYFHADGKVHARFRACNLPAERANDRKGRWRLHGGQFCGSELGDVDECYSLVRVSADTFKRVHLEGRQTAWELIVVKEGNPEGL